MLPAPEILVDTWRLAGVIWCGLDLRGAQASLPAVPVWRRLHVHPGHGGGHRWYGWRTKALGPHPVISMDSPGSRSRHEGGHGRSSEQQGSRRLHTSMKDCWGTPDEWGLNEDSALSEQGPCWLPCCPTLGSDLQRSSPSQGRATLSCHHGCQRERGEHQGVTLRKCGFPQGGWWRLPVQLVYWDRGRWQRGQDPRRGQDATSLQGHF